MASVAATGTTMASPCLGVSDRSQQRTAQRNRRHNRQKNLSLHIILLENHRKTHPTELWADLSSLDSDGAIAASGRQVGKTIPDKTEVKKRRVPPA